MRELIACFLSSLVVIAMIVFSVAILLSFVFNYAASRHRKPTLAWWWYFLLQLSIHFLPEHFTERGLRYRRKYLICWNVCHICLLVLFVSFFAMHLLGLYELAMEALWYVQKLVSSPWR